MVKKGLGKGLDVLIPIYSQDNSGYLAADTLPDSQESLFMIPVAKIVPNRYQPRREFSPEKLAELVASIREKGVIQPILVHSYKGEYELIAGERRWRAAMELGMGEIPAIIKDVSDVELLELSLIENIQRENLNAIEEALAYQQLINEFNFRQEDLAVKVGKDSSSISNTLRLLKLPGEIQDALKSEQVSMGHARALLALPSAKTMLKVAQRVMEEGLSVRETERLVQEMSGFGRVRSKSPKKPEERKTFLAAFEEELKSVLGTKVQIKYGKKKKTIEIEFYDDDDLERIVKIFQ